ncbi:OmpA family protein [Aliishimia ponticola]|uniref:OmpA family protein n=1 Tax=Aliishimia ponticola TaxID=2499833 RepID=A0A4S4NGR6_9RHOB|nr:OmpA family protein [Aliishimia ponticola]THH35270.1 OmpA family protein [Aliishimia ponticola]
MLVLGVGALGWYGSTNNAKTMEAEVTEAARAAAEGTVHPVMTRVSGRDIVVSGVANGEAERDQILAAMNDVTGRRVVRDELRVLETASPFALNASKTADGVTYAGVIPTEVDRATLAARIGAAADDLDLMAGAPDSAWTGVVMQGLDGLAPLQDGTMDVSDRTVSLTGTARTPAEDAAARAALSDLPDGYDTSIDVTVLDDGTPLRLAMDLAEDGAVTATGKVPAALERSALTEALARDFDGELAQSVLPPATDGWADASKIGAEALGKLHSGALRMTEDSLTLTGAATPDAKAEAEALLAGLPAGISASSDIALYDDGAPFSLEMAKGDDSAAPTGKFPADLPAAEIIGTRPATGIRNAFVSDETGSFATVASNGAEALSQLENGKLTVVGTEVTLTGTAKTPTEADAAMALLGDLPEGYAATFDIATRDDGTPPNFDVTYLADQGASVSGKLPAGLELSGIAGALGLADVSGEPVQGLIGEATQATEQLNAVSGWLPELETMTFNSNDDVVTVTASAAPGVDEGLVTAGLTEALGANASVTVTAMTDLPDDGATRTNRATGRAERFTNGFWLPVLDFVSDAETCEAQSTAALQDDKINFVSGSAQLDAQSVRAVNAVAAIVRKCLAETDLNVEIGGHTDSQGGDDLNRQLSQSRAEAVRAALIARGVAEADITATGYGEDQPIADNETAEGRAANRRTTITWYEPVAEAEEAAAEPEAGADAAADKDNTTNAGE